MLTQSSRGIISRQVKRDEKKKVMDGSPYSDIMQLASMVGNSGMEALLRKESETSASGASQPLPDSLRARFEGEGHFQQKNAHIASRLFKDSRCRLRKTKDFFICSQVLLRRLIA